MKKRIFFVIIFIISLFSLSSCLYTESTSPIYALDTQIIITFYNTKNYNEYYQNIKKIYYEVNDVANDFENKENSVYKLNLDRKIEGNATLIELINYAISYQEETNGAFNPFIGRLTHLWKESLNNKKVLDQNTINKELDIMNNTSIKIEDNTISLIGDGNLDLGAIAKGFATYKAETYLKENNVTNYLINAGSSNISVGQKPHGSFKIGLNNPYKDGYIKIIDVNNLSISTSSGEQQNTIINDTLYHHLINPFTGYPSTYYDSVITFGSNSMALDVYSTAIFMMDLDSAKSFSETHNIDIILFKDDQIIYEGKNIYEEKK